MRFGRRLGRAFFERDCVTVARELVGCVLVRRLASGALLAGRIMEVEAYLGDGSDPASHSHRGPTLRNQSMFGPAGHLYVYKSYGIHTCANLVCEPEGSGAAILLRAIEPLVGLDAMRAHRGLDAESPGRPIARGPGRLAEAMALTLADDGASVLRGEIEIRLAPRDWTGLAVACGPRVGIRLAAELPLRFYAEGAEGEPWVSPYRPGVRRRSEPAEQRAGSR